jgi:hypothetical protein
MQIKRVVYSILKWSLILTGSLILILISYDSALMLYFEVYPAPDLTKLNESSEDLSSTQMKKKIEKINRAKKIALRIAMTKNTQKKKGLLKSMNNITNQLLKKYPYDYDILNIRLRFYKIKTEYFLDKENFKKSELIFKEANQFLSQAIEKVEKAQIEKSNQLKKDLKNFVENYKRKKKLAEMEN